jgi:1-acyl-sn-glycerol-3-phosphate acyltransferase
MSNLTAFIKVVLLLLSGFVIAFVQLIGFTVWPQLGRRAPLYYHRFLLRLVGMKLTVKGDPPPRMASIVVANHASYIDIIVLGSLVQGSFVAKSEVASWPFFGQLAKLGRTLFVDRTKRTHAKQHRDMIVDRLNQGDSIMIFPEGTSNDGNHVDPFKSTLFSAAEVELVDGSGQPLVRPASIAYTGLHGLPTGRRLRSLFAWYGDMTLLPHLWQLLKLGAVEADVWFHPPVRASDFASRKELTQHCQQVISYRFADLLAGRDEKAA